MDQPAKPITVVLRYREGEVLRCTLVNEFSVRDFELDVEDSDGHIHTVDVMDLKAVFFTKDSRQRSNDMATNSRNLPEGAMAKVEFFDGEIIRGGVSQYTVSDAGFFLYPTASESNNDRIFVVATALDTVSIDG